MSSLASAIQKLSKSSPQAVFTPKSNVNSESQDIFDYLYIETEIENYYKELLEKNKSQKVVIFLCGSSGDGKSAIIGKNQICFEKYYDTHIDATHSFKPDQSAIDALNERFSNFKHGTRSLIIGINIGILLNFSREGSNDHDDIKKAIQVYIRTGESSQSTIFVNFEDFSKFEIKNNVINSTFIHKLLDKITQQSTANPFYKAFQLDRQNSVTNTVHNNFQVLSLAPVKQCIVELLITVHLKYDQFLTTRSLLDFIYTLLDAPKSLIDRLFEDNSNSIIANIRKEDPCLLRTEKLDTFILERTSNKIDKELNAFVDAFNEKFASPVLILNDPHLLIRTFYLFRNDACATNYHERFRSEFNDPTTHEFIALLYAHRQYAKNQDKTLIQQFYNRLEKAILAYANKRLPYLSAEEWITLSEINDYALCTLVEFDSEWDAIKNHTKHLLHSIPCFLRVNDRTLGEISITLGMYKLIQAINDGYRPNKHDRNTIIIFEELLERIIEQAKDTKKLFIIKDDEVYEFKDNEGKIKVKKHAR